MHQNALFWNEKKIKHFLGKGHSPSQGHTHPTPPPRRFRRIDPPTAFFDKSNTAYDTSDKLFAGRRCAGAG